MFCCVKSIYTLSGCSVMCFVCVCVCMWNQTRTVPEHAHSRANTFYLYKAHKVPPHPALAHSANPADPVMTNCSYQPAPAPPSPRFSLRPFLVSLHWVAWGTWEDIPRNLPLLLWIFKSCIWVFWKVWAQCLTVWLWYGWNMYLKSFLACTSPFVETEMIFITSWALEATARMTHTQQWSRQENF